MAAHQFMGMTKRHVRFAMNKRIGRNAAVTGVVPGTPIGAYHVDAPIAGKGERKADEVLHCSLEGALGSGLDEAAHHRGYQCVAGRVGFQARRGLPRCGLHGTLQATASVPGDAAGGASATAATTDDAEYGD